MTAANDPRDSRLVKLEQALEHAGNTHTVADVVDMIRAQRAMLWEEAGVLVVTEMVDYPRARAMRLWLVAGDLEACDSLLPNLEHWAKVNGCTRIEAEARRGWALYGAGHGYHAVATVFRKELGR